ncbi:hypothetical protein O6H91_02G033700 [Diphasiastrum complanatum]|uniref:Uncharacterized protein n=5 Tax=Diphasiastrum complanatum TaxID=34168 RepID=A0ACC2EDW9_DIPCM|nr:hypothetical protein O6H91_Y248700 [Diphasiastrum complanatum]KAJ7299342.1 hypothetical protein O6H91_Y248700 [Diphasiastrum complanatum]KAJ7299343.1 hypothetical protein O6H91_Y248700 [Diphasiastrum complanatum]KAJ7299344.1 hypothetical protein O6H91_Y248700 [Diphasiastrum complanatum]KAJ7299345.1 hypothetical protein O6H91_Y248700 [Diphasiastrum complanatum]
MCLPRLCFCKMGASAGTQSRPASKAPTDTGKGKNQSKRVVHGYALVKGFASHPLEDYHVAEYRSIGEHELGLFAIFDGHLGNSVPAFLQNHLFNNILKEPGFFRDPVNAIKKAYSSTDQIILDRASVLGAGGSTAVTAILLDGKRLVIANIGDSRAVLSRAGTAVQLSVDHEPSKPSERVNIQNRGGFVLNMPGDVPRVDGQLAVARAFGDKNLKEHLSADPDIKEEMIDPATEFLILASDGLWKVVQNQEAVDLVRKIHDPKTAAKRLTDEALARKSKDDISCIVVRFL